MKAQAIARRIAEQSKKRIGNVDRKQIAVAILLFFLVAFLFNVFKFNRKPDAEEKAMTAAHKKVEALQKGTVSEIEAACDALDAAAGQDPTKSRKAHYRRRFRGSIVVGDSVTEGLSLYGWLSEEQVFSKVGASVVNGETLFNAAAATYPHNAFFAYGMNDMGNYGGDAKAFTRDYTALLKAFHKTSPKTKIYICSITTPTEKAIAGNRSIGAYKEFNKALKKMCKKNGYTYVDVSDILENNPKLYAGDGIHAQSEYYPHWLDRMIEKAGM